MPAAPSWARALSETVTGLPFREAITALRQRAAAENLEYVEGWGMAVGAFSPVLRPRSVMSRWRQPDRRSRSPVVRLTVT